MCIPFQGLVIKNEIPNDKAQGGECKMVLSASLFNSTENLFTFKPCSRQLLYNSNKQNCQEIMNFCFFIGVVVNVYRLHSIKEIRHLLGLFWGELYWHIEPNLSFKIIVTHIL